MKSTKTLLFLSILISLYACKNDSKLQDKNAAKAEAPEYSNNTDPECVAPANWFTIINGTRKTPAPNEGPTSAFANNDSVNNCDFHKWSWQKFLYLTNEVNDRPLFLDNLIQVSSHGKKLEQNKGIILTDTAQASSTIDILKTPNYSSGNPPSTTVYYSILVDTLFYDTMIKYAPIAKKDPSKIKDITFPVGALEVKTSWINANALTDSSSYYITDGEINGVKAKVALLGMHVVGIVENHPEFIWATFEHQTLAPKYDWSKATPTSDAPVTSTTDYPFFNKNTTSTVKNITTQNGIYTNVFSVYKYGVPVKKEIEGSFNVQVYMETSQDGSQNFNNIRTINKSVKSQLKGIWNNYFYNGSIWINTEGYESTLAQAELLDSLGGHLSNSKPKQLPRGSVAASNITMETYVQVGFAPTSIHATTVNDLVNCFSCHNASSHGNLSPLNISHVFTGYLDSLNGLNKKEIKQRHVDEIIQQFIMRQKANN
ncbi:hypothetical protein A8C32_00135 [Flavivirga aquatica]|uniref:Cytochrome c domain-containing protein n=1 Tax=Flavivirga aquatica TaxID=1849968 RepID=A0A1E5TC12_9FLAO|nr:hypothetical protein [Flavivirga aquatica]OEK08905.1 hypothetical protein A8C32_00135 [Flavivirga aquatica]